MKCQCGNNAATRLRIVYHEGETIEMCDQCGNVDMAGVPDVHFTGRYFDEHLGNEKHRNGQWVESKRHKARLLKEAGLREAGSDKNPILGKTMPFIKDPKARQRFFKDNFGGPRGK